MLKYKMQGGGMKRPAVLLWAGSALLYGIKCAGAFSFFTSARPPTSVGALVVLVSGWVALGTSFQNRL